MIETRLATGNLCVSKPNVMYHTIKPFSLLLILATLAVACSKPVPNPPGTEPANTVQFMTDEQSVAENAATLPVGLQLHVSATRTETITLSFTSTQAQYGRDFTTQPEAVNGRLVLTIEKGRREVSFQVIPMNNQAIDGTKDIHFTLAEDGSVKPQGRKTSKVTIVDDEGPSTIVFANANATMAENAANGYTAVLSITPQAAAEGFAELSLVATNATYGQHFATEPALNNGRIRIPVSAGAAQVQLRIRPVDDAVVNQPRTIRLNVTGTSQSLQIGTQSQVVLTITDNDLPPAQQFLAIGAIRQSYQGTASYFWATTRIQGIVTSVSDNIAPNIAYIEDGTGGIALRFAANHNLQPGDVVTVDVEGAQLTEANGALEIRQLAVSAAQKTGSDIFVSPTYTLQQLYGRTNLEGQLVTLTNVQFIDANGVNTLEGNRTITDGNRTATVRTESFASFRNRVIPSGRVNVMGILIEQHGHYTIVPLTSQSIY